MQLKLTNAKAVKNIFIGIKIVSREGVKTPSPHDLILEDNNDRSIVNNPSSVRQDSYCNPDTR